MGGWVQRKVIGEKMLKIGLPGKLGINIKNMNLSRSFTCPYCMREYKLDEAKYVCPDCKKEVTPSGKPPYKCKCGGLATSRVCKHTKFIHLDNGANNGYGEDIFFNCDDLLRDEEYVKNENGSVIEVSRTPAFDLNEIPPQALETPNLPFSIIGVSGSGKTNYITVMLQELAKSPSLRLALSAENKATRDHQKENARMIYQEHIVPESTEAGAKLPQIWCIKNMLKKHGNTVPTYTFTIFDGAGEDHENMDASSTECRYINASKAIILTLDPLILQGVRCGGIVDSDTMSNSGGDNGEFKDAVDVVNGVATFIKTARGIKATKMLDIPVAVVLTKFDTILSHPSFVSNSVVKNQSFTTTNGRFNKGEIDQVDAEIRNWLYNIDEAPFIDALASNFKEFVFFGVSSYGEPPENIGQTPSQIKPHRVLDPILWLFNKFGFVD